MLNKILFNLFASVAIGAGCGVIVSKNPIYSLVFLILVFCNATGLLILFKIELIAAMFIIIYVGAIAVLFLFVVMMLNIKRVGKEEKKEEEQREEKKKKRIETMMKISLVGGGILMMYKKMNERGEKVNWGEREIKELWEECYQVEKGWTELIETTTNIQAIGNVMYSYYSYYVIMAGMILLIAMIGAIVLTMYKRKNAWKKQIIYKQIARKYEKTINKAS